ncbi:DUF1543 domain-containing protein [Taibaiella helva]|uniref:DUF1543 domain-containing protein n=1 Tax=Taibaiella helva TaxID=2301235 RepID=UPI000E58A645|nr:DUF1543 domain-containing protein [Taibaiella helva]
MEPLYLHMAILGCTPPGRFTEQHDVFFGIGTNMSALVPELLRFWPEAEGRLHIDAWRRVTHVDGHHITIVPANGITEALEPAALKLFFLNLGGYRPGEFEEYHYKMLVVAADQGKAIQQAKKTAFYKHSGFKGAESHVDDKYGVDVDDVHLVKDILDARYKEMFRVVAGPKEDKLPADTLQIGYFKLDKL